MLDGNIFRPDWLLTISLANRARLLFESKLINKIQSKLGTGRWIGNKYDFPQKISLLILICNTVGYLFNSGYKISVIESQREESRGVNSNKISTRGRNKKAKEKFNEQENAPFFSYSIYLSTSGCPLPC